MSIHRLLNTWKVPGASRFRSSSDLVVNTRNRQWSARPCVDYLRGHRPTEYPTIFRPFSDVIKECEIAQMLSSFTDFGPFISKRRPRTDLGILFGAQIRCYKGSSLLIVCFQIDIRTRFGGIQTTLFLEQFRYIIVASQLLSEHSAPVIYKHKAVLESRDDGATAWDDYQAFVATPTGLITTAITAFAFAYTIRWLRSKVFLERTTSEIAFLFSSLAILAAALLYPCGRYWLHQIQTQAIEQASLLTAKMRDLDSVVSAGMALIQEVELVSRGYSM